MRDAGLEAGAGSLGSYGQRDRPGVEPWRQPVGRV